MVIWTACITCLPNWISFIDIETCVYELVDSIRKTYSHKSHLSVTELERKKKLYVNKNAHHIKSNIHK